MGVRVGGGPPSADVASLDVKLAQECFARAGLNKETFWEGGADDKKSTGTR